jgi:hypothetical protein
MNEAAEYPERVFAVILVVWYFMTFTMLWISYWFRVPPARFGPKTVTLRGPGDAPGFDAAGLALCGVSGGGVRRAKDGASVCSSAQPEKIKA